MMNELNPPSSDQLLELITGQKWIPLAALLIAFIVRLLKSDTKIPIDIPGVWRFWLAFGLGIVSGVLEKIALGTPLRTALANGAVSSVLAILAHLAVIESIRGGKEFVIPGLIKPGARPAPGKPISLSPPPDADVADATSIPPTSPGPKDS